MRDPLAHTCHVSQGSVEEEISMGRKMILLLRWPTCGVRLAAGAAQARRDVVKRYGLAGWTRRSVSARTRVARRCWADFVGRMCERAGEARLG